jgi:hypothetical protein
MNESVSIVGCYGFPIRERAGFERVSGDLARAQNTPHPDFRDQIGRKSGGAVSVPNGIRTTSN